VFIAGKPGSEEDECTPETYSD